MARNPPRPVRRGGRGRPPPRRPAPLEEYDEGQDDPLEMVALPSDEPIRLTRNELARRRDLFVVGVLTPAVAITTVLGVLILSQAVYPDPNPPEIITPPTATVPLTDRRATATPVIVAEPIDPVRLSQGVVERPIAFDWPEIDGWKLVPNPGRPEEQADYTPLLAETELRRLVAVTSISVVPHTNGQFAVSAAGELAKSYPLRRDKNARVVDQPSTLGYIPDDSGVGVVFTVAQYRVQVEVIAASPPVRPNQRTEIEYHALHLSDHIARRIQEVTSSGRRTPPEAAAVHWRDHISRSLPSFGS